MDKKNNTIGNEPQTTTGGNSLKPKKEINWGWGVFVGLCVLVAIIMILGL